MNGISFHNIWWKRHGKAHMLLFLSTTRAHRSTYVHRHNWVWEASAQGRAEPVPSLSLLARYTSSSPGNTGQTGNNHSNFTELLSRRRSTAVPKIDANYSDPQEGALGGPPTSKARFGGLTVDFLQPVQCHLPSV